MTEPQNGGAGSLPPPPSPPSSPPPGGTEVEPPAPKGRFLTRYAGIPETGWSGMTAAIGVMVAALVTILGSVAVAVFDPQFESTAARNAAQLVVALGLGGTAVGFALLDAKGKLGGAGGAFGRLGLVGRVGIAAIGLAALAWFIYILSAAVLSPLLQPDQQDVTRELGTDKESGLSIAVAAILIVILAPLSEELFFRGFMFASLRRSMSLWPAALIAAIVWGSLHLGGGNIGVAIQLMVFGVILAWLYERSGTLWAPIIAHGINNTIAFVLLVTEVV